MRTARCVLLLAILAAALVIARCGGGGGGTPATGDVTVTGTVVSAADATTPVADAYVYVPLTAPSARQEEEYASATTDASGQFDLPGIPRRAVSLGVDLGPQRGFQGMVADWDLSAFAGGATLDITITLLPANVRIHRLVVRPEEPDVLVGHSVQFAAVDETDGTRYSPTWVTEGNVGTISKTGLFTARRAGQGIVKALLGGLKGGTGVYVSAQLPPLDDEAPTATLAGSPTQGTAPLEVTFDGSAADSDGQVVDYVLSFGDGTARPLTGPPAGVLHAYPGPNTYTAVLKVRDNQGAPGVAKVEITVDNEFPVAVASASPTTGAAPLTVQLSSADSTDSDGQIVAYHWTFGDRTPGSSLPNPSHVYQNPGQYAAVLRVKDSGGAVSFDAVQVQVGP